MRTKNHIDFRYLSWLKMTTKSWVTSSKASSLTDWLLITRCRCSTHLSSSSYRCFKELFSTDGNLDYRLFCFMLYVVWSSSSYHGWKWLFWTEMEHWSTRCCSTLCDHPHLTILYGIVLNGWNFGLRGVVVTPSGRLDRRCIAWPRPWNKRPWQRSKSLFIIIVISLKKILSN